MILYLVRHGKAHRDSPSGRDADRALKSRGEAQSLWLGQAISGSDTLEPPRLILASGLERATQTARIIQSAAGGSLGHAEVLEPGWPIEDMIDLVQGHMDGGEQGPLMLVGHNPQMEILCSVLDGEACEASFTMRTGMAAVFDTRSGATVRRGATLVTTLRQNDEP